MVQNDPEALAVRAVGRKLDPVDKADRVDPVAHAQLYAAWLDHPDPAVVANALLCLIHQANYLLDQQREALERDFVQTGGHTEQLAAARLAERQKVPPATPANTPAKPQAKAPVCPKCGQPMALRTARQGARAGSQFWGCSAYPVCRGTLPV